MGFIIYMTHFQKWLKEQNHTLEMLTSSDEYFSWRKKFDTEMELMENEPSLSDIADNIIYGNKDINVIADWEQIKEDDIRHDCVADDTYEHNEPLEDLTRNEF
jgi:hypothetical protein